MALGETLLFYLVIGLAVAAAVWISSSESAAWRWFRVATAVPFWPLYLPVLLTGPHAAEPARDRPPLQPADALAEGIADVQCELNAALASLDGWAEHVLSRERARIDELRGAWAMQAQRIREMDRVLAQCDVMHGDESDLSGPSGASAAGQSQRARRDNITRLRQVRDRAHQDFTTTLARVRELVSLIHLAKFTGAPASRAEQLVAEIAASVEGLSEVAQWREPPSNFC
jgi:hypothetical protein